jgi:Protein of unknown function (DUF4239)
MLTWINLAIVIGLLGLAIAGMLVTQKWFPHQHRERHNDVAGFVFAAISVLYAVLVAFVIIALWEANEGVRQNTYHEANDLAAVYWLSREMPLPAGSVLEHLTLDYARTVADTEWTMMSDQHESSRAATALMYQIRDAAFAMNPQTMRDQVIFDQVTTNVQNLAADRRVRLDAVNESVPGFLWVALIGGGVVTIGFTFLFGLSNTWAHVGMVCALALVIAISLVLINALDYPFGGPGRIGPEAFEVFLSRLPPPR